MRPFIYLLYYHIQIIIFSRVKVAYCQKNGQDTEELICLLILIVLVSILFVKI